MGLMSNTVSICQFQVSEGQLPPIEDRYEWLRERLCRQRFVDIKDTSEEASIGIVELHDTTKATFDDPGAFWIGTYFCFTIRQDVRRIPSAVLKEEVDKRIKAWLEEHPGYSRVPKKEREAVKDATRAHLLTKTLPIPSTIDVAWNTLDGIVTIGTTSNKGIELATTILSKAFPEFRFQLIHPYARALKVAEKIGLAANLQDRNLSQTDSVMESIQANKWIGTDLLLWMLYTRATGPTDGIAVWIDNKIVLQQSDEDGDHTVSIAGVQNRLGEVKAALRDGKQITQATVYMEGEDGTWRMTLKADTFHFASYKCPSVQIEKDDTTDLHDERQAVFLERMHLIEKGIGLFENVLVAFLTDRLGSDWAENFTQGIAEWIKE